MPTTVAPLLPFPSARARANLSASQLAALYAKISRALEGVLNLPSSKRDTAQTVAFISSYARDVAHECLQGLIWDSTPVPGKGESRESKAVRARVLNLAERLAPSGLLPLETLLDLSVAFIQHPSRLKSILNTAFTSSRSLFIDVDNEAVPAFTNILSTESTTGLYDLRKAAHCLLCFIRMAPVEAKLSFARNTMFMTSMASAYDAGLGAVARSYGGLRLDGRSGRAPDEWERLILETKVALLDTLHVLLTALFDSLARGSGTLRNAETARALDMLFALKELPAAADGGPSSSGAPTLFLNLPMLVDYQHAHDLSRLLETTIARAEADDARADLLAVTLRALGDCLPGPGALTLLLGSGVPQGVDSRTRPAASAPVPIASISAVQLPIGTKSAAEEAIDAQVSEVLSILPDHPPDYVRALLGRPEYAGVERVIEALLEGTAPPLSELQPLSPPPSQQQQQPESEWEYTRDRRNVFDGQEMDLTRVHIGKKRGDADAILGDRTFISQMKSDILRRAEAVSDGEADEDDDGDAAALAEIFGSAYIKVKSRAAVREIAFEEELDTLDTVRVAGDGEETDEEGDGGSEPDEGKASDPHTILELAYVSNPKVFERDAATRRGKDRAALREQTGWADEQIEGWHVMLERNPKIKGTIMQKHEFRGEQPSLPPSAPSSKEPSRSTTPSRGGRGGGRGRSGGRGRGRGHRGGGSGENSSERGKGDRAWKDKSKASQANHSRKRGHERKMQKAGGPS